MKKWFMCVIAIAGLLIPASCNVNLSYKIRRVPVMLSDVFYIGDRPKTDLNVTDVNGNVVGSLKGSGWMSDDGSGVWETVFPTNSTGTYKEGGPGAEVQYDGCRLVGIDQDLFPRNTYLDVSAYDGMIFKYKSNSDGSVKLFDKSYFFSAAGKYYTAHGWYQSQNGTGDPAAPYREVAIPFSSLTRSPVISNANTDDNNLENFDRDQLIHIMFDCRQPEDQIGGVQCPWAWSEIVDFDFFVYE
jgi:hypothetical protein